MILTIDVTDWIQGSHRNQPISTHVWISTLFLLELLRRNFTTATFFIEYKVAKKYPLLVRKIANAGHEVACYVPPKTIGGKIYAHQIVNTLELLETITQTKVIGIRTEVMPIEQTSFALYCALLEKLGIKYDSSHYTESRKKSEFSNENAINTFKIHNIKNYSSPDFNYFGGSKFRQQSYIRTHFTAKSLPREKGIFHLQAYELGLNEYNHIEDLIDLSSTQKREFNGRKKTPLKLQKLLKDFPFDSFLNSFYKT